MTEENPPVEEPAPATPADIMRAFGYDPDAVQSLVVTPEAVVAIDAQYPEPLTRQE